jgi:CRISPR-associated protein Csm5
MKLKLHTVSPVHIGAGNELAPFEYFIEDGIYYRLDQDKAFKIALETHPDFPDKFSSWIDRTSGKLRKAKDNATQAEIRSKFNFKYFCESVLQDYDLIDKIKTGGYAYKCNIPYGLQKKKQVNELLKDANNNLYIPGSSIKGALKTILAWKAFSILDNDVKTSLLRDITNSNDFRRVRGRFLDDALMNKLFVCGKKKRFKGEEKTDYSDIKFDIMKFIHISDAYPIKAKMAVYPANLYLTDKSPQSQTPALEVIEFNSSFEFSITINEEEVRTIYEEAMKQGSKTWIGFDKRFKNLFGFYPHEVNNGELEEKIVLSIKSTVSDFYRAIWNREKNWIARFKRDIVENRQVRSNANIESIKEFFDVYDEIPVMFKIGWASGFAATTIFDALESDEKTRPYIQKVFDQFKIGIPQNKKRDPNVNPANVSKFPKSKRLTAEDKMEPIDPFGWVALLDEEQTLDLE